MKQPVKSPPEIKVNVWLVWLALALLLWSGLAFGKVQTFELNKAVEERVFLCLKYEVVEPMHDAAVKGDMDTVRGLSMQAQIAGVCGAFQVEIVYNKLLKEGKDADGNLYTIYEATVQGVRVYVPLRNYRHRGDA